MTAGRSAELPWTRRAVARDRWWALAFVAALAVHLAALYWPRVTIVGPVTWTDKVVHPLLFLVPVVVASLWWRRVLPVAVVFAVHAPASELIQHYLLPNRTGDPWDAAADLLGVGLGVLVATTWLSHRRRSGAPSPR